MKNFNLDPKVLFFFFYKPHLAIFKMDLLALEADSRNSYNGS